MATTSTAFTSYISHDQQFNTLSLDDMLHQLNGVMGLPLADFFAACKNDQQLQQVLQTFGDQCIRSFEDFKPTEAFEQKQNQLMTLMWQFWWRVGFEAGEFRQSVRNDLEIDAIQILDIATIFTIIQGQQQIQLLLDQLFLIKPQLLPAISMLGQRIISHFHELHQHIIPSILLLNDDKELANSLMYVVDMANTLTSSCRSSPLILEQLVGAIDLSKVEEFHIHQYPLLREVVSLYEVDLPVIEEHLVRQSSAPECFEAIGIIRMSLLELMNHWFQSMFLSQTQANDAHFDILFSVILEISHLTEDQQGETGSFLTDWNQLCSLQQQLTEYCEQHGYDTTRLDYLKMIITELPQRPTDEFTCVDESLAVAAKDITLDDPVVSKAPSIGTTELVSQVTGVFPDLGHGFVEACLESCNFSAENVINRLLEDSLPDDVKHLDRNLAVNPTSDAIPSTGDHVRANVFDGDEFDTANKLDPSRAWVGKKPQAKKYSPATVNEDKEFVSIQKQALLSYDNVPYISGDEYDDDFDDEYDDYVPVNDEHLADYEQILERNRIMKARVEEESFWENMRNPNTRPIEEAQAVEGSGSSQDKSDTNKAGESSNVNDTAGRRNYRNKNKAKFGNHNRKDRALRKRG